MNKFLEWLKLNKNSSKTISAYHQQVNCFGKWCDYAFTQENLNNYLIKLKEENKSINTINLFKNAFIAYCQSVNLELNIPSPKKVRKNKIDFYFTDEDMEKIYKYVPLVSENYQQMNLVFKFMFYTGCRPSALFNIEVDNIDFEKKNILFRSAKGEKDRIVPFLNNDLYNELKKYCNCKKGKVFNISYDQLLYAVKKLKKEMQLSEKITPRTFRISFAKYCLRKGMDISYLKKLMGHTDIKITELYAEPDEKMIKEFCEKIRKEE